MPQPLKTLAFATQVRLYVILRLRCKAGYGEVVMNRYVVWPGCPQIGQVVEQSEAICPLGGDFFVEDVRLDLDGEEEVLHVSCKPVELQENIVNHNLNHPQHKYPLTKRFFATLVKRMVEYGWSLTCEPTWYPPAERPHEHWPIEDFEPAAEEEEE